MNLKPVSAGMRQDGVALWAFLGLFSMMIAGVATIGMLTVIQNRAGTESERQLAAHQIADSGAQIANALLRASAGSPSTTMFTENLAGGTAGVTMTDVGGVWEVTSTGSFEGQTDTVVMHLRFTPGFVMDGAVQVRFGAGIEVGASAIPALVDDSSLLSGRDHDAAGAELVDQSAATYGLALAALPGAVDWDLTVDTGDGAVVLGTPAESVNDIDGDAEVFHRLINHARNNADVVISGGTSLDGGDTGSFGTSATPLLVYVELGADEQLDLEETFAGHGTLVISASDVGEDAVLEMEDTAQWSGLVIVEVRGQADSEDDDALIEIDGSATLLGGLAVEFTGDDRTYSATGEVLAVQSSAAVKYSSQLLANAPGVSVVEPVAAEVIAYRRP